MLGICDRLTRNGFSISSHLESIARWRTIVRDLVGPVTQADFDLVSHFDVQTFPQSLSLGGFGTSRETWRESASGGYSALGCCDQHFEGTDTCGSLDAP